MIKIIGVILINLLVCIQSTILLQKSGLLSSHENNIKIIQQIVNNAEKFVTVSFSIEEKRNFTYTLATAAFDQQQQITKEIIEQALDKPTTYFGSADIEAFIQGNTQHIRLQKDQSKEQKLYISITNFDPNVLKRNLTYKIVIESASVPYKKGCLQKIEVLNNQKVQNCLCKQGYFGQYCQNKLTQLSESEIIAQDLKQDQMIYYVIPKMNQQIILTIQVFGEEIDLYLLKGQGGRPANYFTFSYGNTGKISLPKQNSNNKGVVQVNTWLSQPLYLTIAKYTSQKTRVLMQFRTDLIFSRFLILLFILFFLSGCFSVSFIFLLKIQYYRRLRRARIYRRNGRARNLIFMDQEELGISPQIKNKHFPTFIIGDIFHPDEQFIQRNIECPICLSEYELKDEVNLLYCGHMFHDECINNWFETHKNCPSCRYVFNSTNLKKHILKIKQITGEQQVTGLRHVQALLCTLPFLSKKQSQTQLK